MDNEYEYTNDDTVYKFGVVVSDEPGTDWRGERPFRPGQVFLFENYHPPDTPAKEQEWWTVGEQIKPWKWSARIEYFDSPRDAAERAYQIIEEWLEKRKVKADGQKMVKNSGSVGKSENGQEVVNGDVS